MTCTHRALCACIYRGIYIYTHRQTSLGILYIYLYIPMHTLTPSWGDSPPNHPCCCTTALARRGDSPPRQPQPQVTAWGGERQPPLPLL